MKVAFSSLDRNSSLFLKKISREVSRKGVSAFVVGGVVRDILLKKKNIRDMDIVTETDAITFAKHLCGKIKGKLTVYPAFRTATIVLKDGINLDLATTRREIYPQSGALPKVEKGKIEDDLIRRDFTINAMAFNITKDRFGDLLDYHGGLQDLKNGRIRILHDKSFIDDPTRILRAIKYEQRFLFRLEPNTLRCVKKAVANRVLQRISADRYFNDFKKILKEHEPDRSLIRMRQFGLFQPIDPSLNIDVRLIRRLQQNIHSWQQLDCTDEVELWFFYFLAMLEKLTENKVSRITNKFDFTRRQKKTLAMLSKVLPLHTKLSKSVYSASKCYELLRPLTDDLVYYLLLRTNSNNVRFQVTRYLEGRTVRLNITGNDVKQLGGISGGRIGHVLDAVLKQKLDKKVKTRSDELRLARSLIYS